MLVIQLKKKGYNTEISEVQSKINNPDHAKFITTQEFNNLTADNFTARSKKSDLAS